LIPDTNGTTQMNLKQKQDRLKTVMSALLKRYPMPQTTTDERFDILQMVALAAISDDPYAPAAIQVMRRLERDYVDWNEVRVTSAHELGQVLHAYRFDPESADALRSVLQLIFERENKLTPDVVSSQEPETIKAYLVAYKNFPPHIYDAVMLLLGLGRDMPAGETVLRFTARIGVAAADSSANAVQLLYRKACGARSMRAVHYATCQHCKELCREKPLCKKCFLVDHCDYGTKQVSGALAKAAVD